MLGEGLQLSAQAGETRINIYTALSRLLLSQDTLPWQYHSISDNVCMCVCVCVCV